MVRHATQVLRSAAAAAANGVRYLRTCQAALADLTVVPKSHEQVSNFSAAAAVPDMLSMDSFEESLDTLQVEPVPLPHGRVFNFSPGPAMLPLDVLEEARIDLMNWKGTGKGVMEMSHRSKEFISIAEKAEADLRALVGVPDNYHVLFLQGGATTQFSAVPLNLAGEGDTADYLVTGYWSGRAITEGSRLLGNANVAAAGDFKSIPDRSRWNLSPDAKFVHYCDNETIQGIEFQSPPDVGDVPLVVDVSSNFLSRPINISDYGVVFGGVHKNVGPSGGTIVIVRDDLVGHARPGTPSMLDWQLHAENNSMYNTPPCFAWYMCGLVFDRLLREGGLAAVQKRNEYKADILYNAIDESAGFYQSVVKTGDRSIENIPFTIPSNPMLEKEFVDQATVLGLDGLRGHATVGGLRASIYNAMPVEGVELLGRFMKSFASKHS